MWRNEQTCTDYFHLMAFWELDYQLWDKHHLMVLSYNLQHPRTYSPQGLIAAIGLLQEFLETDISPQQMREKTKRQVNSNNRQYKITGTSDSHGEYENPIHWSMTCTDVIDAGIENYYDSVDKWAESIYHSLKQVNYLD